MFFKDKYLRNTMEHEETSEKKSQTKEAETVEKFSITLTSLASLSSLESLASLASPSLAFGVSLPFLASIRPSASPCLASLSSLYLPMAAFLLFSI
jgi:hypothetical protein